MSRRLIASVQLVVDVGRSVGRSIPDDRSDDNYQFRDKCRPISSIVGLLNAAAVAAISTAAACCCCCYAMISRRGTLKKDKRNIIR